MGKTPAEIEMVLEQVRDLLIELAHEDGIGSVTVIRGGNQYQVEMSKTRRLKPIRRMGQANRPIISRN